MVLRLVVTGRLTGNPLPGHSARLEGQKRVRNTWRLLRYSQPQAPMGEDCLRQQQQTLSISDAHVFPLRVKLKPLHNKGLNIDNHKQCLITLMFAT